MRKNIQKKIKKNLKYSFDKFKFTNVLKNRKNIN